MPTMLSKCCNYPRNFIADTMPLLTLSFVLISGSFLLTFPVQASPLKDKPHANLTTEIVRRAVPFRLPLDDGTYSLPNVLFYPALSEAKEREKEHILKVFHSFMERHNIRYLMGGGLIIGTMRHHGMVPWDGDVDIGVAKGDQAALEKAVSEDSAFLTRHSIVTLPFRKSPLHRGHDGMFFMTSASQHPETHVYGHPVPVVEVYLVPSEGGHWMPKYCNHPPRMRLLFNQGGVAFWTCQKMIDAKYRIVASGYASATGGGTSLRPPELLLNEKSGCKAAWNHPSLNDVLNGSHLNATGLRDGSIPKIWKTLINKTPQNPNGMWMPCAAFRPFYNFASQEGGGRASLYLEAGDGDGDGDEAVQVPFFREPPGAECRAAPPAIFNVSFPTVSVLTRGDLVVHRRYRTPFQRGNEVCAIFFDERYTPRGRALPPQYLGTRCQLHYCLPAASLLV